jgi:hypothetical protein
MMDRAEIFSTERKGDRHGQGSDAQQQGKEETESRQEPQEGRRGAGQSVRDRQDAGGPKPQQQEELTPGFARGSAARGAITRNALPRRVAMAAIGAPQ